MSTNATLTQIERRTVTGAGGEIFTAGPTLAVDVTCTMVKSGQRWDLGETIKNASRVVYLFKDDWAGDGAPVDAGGPPAVAEKVHVVMEDETEELVGQVVAVVNESKDDISHWQIFITEV